MSVLVCPVCQGEMREISHQSVRIDSCTRCRGVWLDRGELETLSNLLAGPPRGGFVAQPQHAADPRRDDRYPSRDRDDDDDDRDDDKRRDAFGRKPKSKTSRFLDFFD